MDEWSYSLYAHPGTFWPTLRATRVYRPCMALPWISLALRDLVIFDRSRLSAIDVQLLLNRLNQTAT